VTTGEPTQDIVLVLWSLRRHPDGAASTETIAAPLPEELTVARTREVLEKAEDQGLVRELVPDWWEMTDSGVRAP
jgi:hypothetical protein